MEFYDGDVFLGCRDGGVETWSRWDGSWTSPSRPDEVGTDKDILTIINYVLKETPDAWNNGIGVYRNDGSLDLPEQPVL